MRRDLPVTSRLALATALLATATVHAQIAAPVQGNILTSSAGVTVTPPAGGAALTTVAVPDGRTIINWKAFDVPAGTETRFLTQTARPGAVLNRVTGASGAIPPSTIAGRLSAGYGAVGTAGADGTQGAHLQVFVVNSAGIVFGPNANVNVGGLVASTRNILNGDFLAGRLRFQAQETDGAAGADGVTGTAAGTAFTALTGAKGVQVLGGSRIATTGKPAAGDPAAGALFLIGATVNAAAGSTVAAASGDTAFVAADDVLITPRVDSPLSIVIGKGTLVTDALRVAGSVQGRSVTLALASQNSITNSLVAAGSLEATGAVDTSNGVVLLADAAPVGAGVTVPLVGGGTSGITSTARITSASEVDVAASGTAAINANVAANGGRYRVAADTITLGRSTQTARTDILLTAGDGGIVSSGAVTLSSNRAGAAGGALASRSIALVTTGGINLASATLNAPAGVLAVVANPLAAGGLRLGSVRAAGLVGLVGDAFQAGLTLAGPVTTGDLTLTGPLTLDTGSAAISTGAVSATAISLTGGRVSAASLVATKGGIGVDAVSLGVTGEVTTRTTGDIRLGTTSTIGTGAVSAGGALRIDAAGAVEAASLSAAGALRIGAATQPTSLVVQGATGAGRALEVTTKGDQTFVGKVSAGTAGGGPGGAATLDAGSADIVLQRDLIATGRATITGAQVTATGVTITGSDVTVSGVGAGSALRLGALSATGPSTALDSATGTVSVTAASGTASVLGAVDAASDYRVRAQAVSLGTGVRQQAGRDILLQATADAVSGGRGLVLAAARGADASLLAYGTGGVALDAGSSIVGRGGALTVGIGAGAGQAIALGAVTANRLTGAAPAGDTLALADLAPTGRVTLGGTVTVDRSLDLQTSGDRLSVGKVTVTGADPAEPAASVRLATTADGAPILIGGVVQAAGAATLDATGAISGGLAGTGLVSTGGAASATGTGVQLGQVKGLTAAVVARGGAATLGELVATGLVAPGAVAASATGAGITITTASTAAGLLDLRSTGDLQLGTGTGADGVVLSAAGDARIGTARATGTVARPRADLRLLDARDVGGLTAGSAATLSATGTLDVLARGVVRLGEASGALGATVKGGIVAIDALASSAGDATAESTVAGATIGSITARGSATVTARTAARVRGAVSAGGDYRVSGATVALGAAEQAADGAVDIVAASTITGDAGLRLTSNNTGAGSGALTLRTTAAVGGSIDLAGTVLRGGPDFQSDVRIGAGARDDRLVLGEVRARGLLGTIDGGAAPTYSVGLERAGAITVGAVTLADRLRLVAGDTLAAGALAANGVEITARGTAGTIPSILATGGDVRITSGGLFSVGGAVTARAGGIALDGAGDYRLGSVAATGGDVTSTGSGAIEVVGLLSARRAGGVGGAIGVDGASRLQTAGLDANGAIAIGQARAVGSVSITGPVAAGGVLAVRTGAGQTYTAAVTAGTSATLEAGGALLLDTLAANGTVRLDAASITARSVTGGASVTLAADDAAVAGTIAGTGVQVDAGRIAIDTLADARGGALALTAAPGGIQLRTGRGASATLSAQGALEAGSVDVTGDLAVLRAAAVRGYPGLAPRAELTAGRNLQVATSGEALLGVARAGADARIDAGTLDVTQAAAGGLLQLATTSGALRIAGGQGGQVSLSAAGALEAGKVDARSDLAVLRATDIRGYPGLSTRAELTAGRNLQVASSGEALLGIARAGADARIDAGTLDVTQAAAGVLLQLATTSGALRIAAGQGGQVSLSAAGALEAGKVEAGGDLAILRATDIRGYPGLLPRADLTAGRNLQVNASGQALLGVARAGGDARIVAGSLDITEAAAGGALALTATGGDLRVERATGGAGATLSTTGGATIGTAAATGAGADLVVAQAGSLGGLTPDERAELSAARDLSALVTGAIRAGPVTAGNAARLTGGSLDVSTIAAPTVELVATAGDATLGSVTATEATLTAERGAATVASLAAGRATVRAGTVALAAVTGGTLDATSLSGGIGIGALTLSGDARLTSATDVAIDTGEVAGAISIVAGGRVTGPVLQAGGAFDARGFDLALGDVAGATVALTAAGGDLTVGNASGANGVSLTKTGGIGGVTVGAALSAANGPVTVASDTFLAAPLIAAGGLATLRTGGDARVDTLRAASLDLASGGDAALTTLTVAGDARIAAAGALRLDGPVAAGSLDASGRTVTLGAADGNVTQAATGAIRIAATDGTVTGLGGLTLQSDTDGDGTGDLLLGATRGLAFASATSLLGGVDGSAAVRLAPGAGASVTLDGVDARTLLSADPAATRFAHDGALTITWLRVRDDATIALTGAAAPLTIGTGLSRTGALQVSTEAALAAGSLSAATALLAQGSTATVETAAGGTVTLAATAGALAVGSVSATGDATLRAAEALRVDTATAGGRLALRATGDVTGRGTAAGESPTVLTGARNVEVVSANGAVLADGITSDGAVAVSAGRAARLARIRAGGDVAVTALTIDAGNIATTAGGLSLTATGGDLALIDGSAPGAMTLAASGAARIGALTAGGTLALSAGTLDLTAARTGGAATLSVAGGATFGALASGGALSIDAGELRAPDLASDGALALRVGGAARLDRVRAIGAAQAAAGSLDIGDIASSAGGLTLAATAGDLVVGRASAAGGAALSATGAARIGTAEAGGALDIAGRTLELASGRAGGALSLTASAGALTLGTGSAGATASLVTPELATIGTLTSSAALPASGSTVTVRSADIAVNGPITGAAITLANTRTGNVLRLGDAPAANAAEFGAAGPAYALSNAELARLTTDRLVVATGPGAAQLGAVTLAASAGRQVVQVQGGGRIDVLGRLEAAGAPATRTIVLGGDDTASGRADTLRIAATADGGGRIAVGAATLDLRANRVVAGVDQGLAAALGLTPGGTPEATQLVATRFVAQPGSNLYNAAAGVPQGLFTDRTLITAGRLVVRYGAFALFQNTGLPGISSGVTLDGGEAGPALVLDPAGAGNAFALFGTINNIGSTATALLGNSVIQVGGDVSRPASRVNGCLIGAAGAGCLANSLVQPNVNLFDVSRADVFRSAEDLSLPFEPLVSTNNEALFSDIAAISQAGDAPCAPGEPCPTVGGTR